MKNSQFAILICTLLLIGVSLVFAVKSNQNYPAQSFNVPDSINRQVSTSSTNGVEIFTVYYQGREYDILRPTTTPYFFQIQRIK